MVIYSIIITILCILLIALNIYVDTQYRFKLNRLLKTYESFSESILERIKQEKKDEYQYTKYLNKRDSQKLKEKLDPDFITK